MSDRLCWQQLHLGDTEIPAGHVEQGEFVRLVVSYPCQYSFMQHMFMLDDACQASSWQMWLEHGNRRLDAGTPAFSQQIGSMIRHRGIIANLTLRENMLLPFLYRGDQAQLEQASTALPEIAEWLDLAAVLDEKAGERTTYTHALVSLARCMLAKPAIIVAQEVHIGMPPEHLDRFRGYSLEALGELKSGLLYLTASEDEGSGLDFARSLTPASECQSFDPEEEI